MVMFRSLRRQIRNFSDLVAFEHTIFSSSFILIAIVVASMQKYEIPWCGWGTFILCVRNLPTNKRPSVDGRISLAALIVFNVFNALIFVCVSYFINTLAFYLCVPFLIILAFYSYTKRFSAMAHWVLGVCLGLAPIAGVIAVMGEITLWSVFWSVEVHILG